MRVAPTASVNDATLTHDRPSTLYRTWMEVPDLVTRTQAACGVAPKRLNTVELNAVTLDQRPTIQPMPLACSWSPHE